MPRLAVLIAAVAAAAVLAGAAVPALAAASPAGGQYSEPDPTSTGAEEPPEPVEGPSADDEGSAGEGVAPESGSTGSTGSGALETDSSGEHDDDEVTSHDQADGGSGKSDELKISDGPQASQAALAANGSDDGGGAGGLGILLPILILLGIAAAVAFRIRDARAGDRA